ncbi:MAG TPA: nucleotide exchange factor GrpE [Nitrosopumilus sp.]|nr:nucleotide exchange factor GrpE [Nitrosopumilus sp.]
MSDEKNSDEIPIEIIPEEKVEVQNSEKSQNVNDVKQSSEDLSGLLELEQQKSLQFEEKLKHVLADFQNLSKKTQTDIKNGVNSKIDEFMLDFLKIYDDFIRAKEVISESKINADGLNSILKNMESLMEKYNVKPIDALGEIFDPNFHEAISIITDSTLDDNTITKEIRKGYISQEKILRPTLVEISKKENNDKND